MIGSVFSPSTFPLFTRDIFMVGKRVFVSDHSWDHAKRPGLDALRMPVSAETHREGPGRVGPVTSVSSV